MDAIGSLNIHDKRNATNARDIKLDILRSAAAIMVVLTHVGQKFNLINRYTSFGAKGVEFFCT